MNKKTTLITAFFLSSFIASACDIWFAGTKGTAQLLVFWMPIIVITGIIFAWVRIDSYEHQFQRSPLLNIGIVGVAFVFVPVYLYKSRPSGSRAKVLGYFVLCFFGYIAVSYAGMEVANHVSL